MKLRIVVLPPLLAVSIYAASQKFDVTIVNRQNSESQYSFFLPGYSQKTTNANANCTGTENTANCSGTGTSTTSSLPARALSYNVSGATLTLQLPDGRFAVVNCDSKRNHSFTGGPRRSCRIPLINNIQAEFDGDNAKLEWPVSIDGKKLQTETYKILSVVGGDSDAKAKEPTEKR